jgi:hypothetical protein
MKLDVQPVWPVTLPEKLFVQPALVGVLDTFATTRFRGKLAASHSGSGTQMAASKDEWSRSLEAAVTVPSDEK